MIGNNCQDGLAFSMVTTPEIFQISSIVLALETEISCF